MSNMRLSILDQAPIPKGAKPAQALKNSETLAILGEELGYHRMWMAEHHNGQSLASSAPEVTAAHLAAKTNRIRIGTGGIMMMHYSPLKVAEVFKTLSALSPGRIDFGVGRAPGGDTYAIYAMAKGKRPEMTDQYKEIETTLKLMNDQKPGISVYDSVVATPARVELPEAWLLGSTGNSAVRAGRMGMGYSFAQFFNGGMTREIFDTYRANFEPSYFMEKPEILVTYATTVAETKEEAEFLAMPIDISRLQLMQGNLIQTLSPEEAKDYPLTEMDKMMIEENRKLHLVGTPEEVGDIIRRDQEQYGFDEAMFNCNQFSIESRKQSYTLLAKELLD